MVVKSYGHDDILAIFEDFDAFALINETRVPIRFQIELRQYNYSYGPDSTFGSLEPTHHVKCGISKSSVGDFFVFFALDQRRVGGSGFFSTEIVL